MKRRRESEKEKKGRGGKGRDADQLFLSKRVCNALFPIVQAGTDSYCVSVTLPYPTRHCMMNGLSRTYGPRRHLASLLPRAACLSPSQPCLERPGPLPLSLSPAFLFLLALLAGEINVCSTTLSTPYCVLSL